MDVPSLAVDPDTIPRVKLTCWGDFALIDEISGAPLKPRGRKARALIAYLASHAGKPTSREKLTGLLWGDRAEAQARASLRQAILELKPLTSGEHALLQVGREQLSLDCAWLRTDLGELREARDRGDFKAVLAALPSPDDRLFADLEGINEGFDDWLRIERARQRDALAAFVAEAAAAAAASGNAFAAHALAARYRELDPAVPLTLAPESEPRLPKTWGAVRPVAQGAGERSRAGWRPAAVIGLLILGMLIGVAAWQRPRLADAGPSTIAVLPFRSLSGPGDSAFADGLSEEVMVQLAHQPGLRVAGRTSSWQFKDRDAGLDEVGRKLRVRYILEGSVRSAGPRIRVNVALTQAIDGLQLWAKTFDGRPDDILAIQERIGTSVAESLGRRLIAPRLRSGSNPSGQVYTLYLTARGLIRERNPEAWTEARKKLLRAVALDPGFAPAWSSLAQVGRWPGGPADTPAHRAAALADARRALALAIDLPEGHGVLGMLLGFDDPEGMRHIERAASLDPNNAEFQFWLGHVRSTELDFAGALAAYRRAAELDPLWSYAQAYAIARAWQMGYRQEALAFVRRVESDGSRYQMHSARAFLAGAQGKFSDQAREFAAAASATPDQGKRAAALWDEAMALDKLHLSDLAHTVRLRCAGIDETDPRPEVRKGRLPSVRELRRHDWNAPYSYLDNGYVAIAAKLMINAGRSADLVRLYDAEEGLMRISTRALPAPPARAFDDGPLIAMALRSVGRKAEADRILLHLQRQADEALARSGGRAPGAFLAAAAQINALLGGKEEALNLLEKAVGTGWAYAVDMDDSSLNDLGQEPAFKSLLGEPRFERIRSRINGDLARERREAQAAERANSVQRTI